jgi:hypothetical protein
MEGQTVAMLTGFTLGMISLIHTQTHTRAGAGAWASATEHFSGTPFTNGNIVSTPAALNRNDIITPTGVAAGGGDSGGNGVTVNKPLSKLVLERVMDLQNFVTMDDAMIYYKSLSATEAADYVSFDTRSPDYMIITQETCGYQLCSTLPDFPKYSTDLLKNMGTVMNDYLRIMLKPFDSVILTVNAATAKTYYDTLHSVKDVPVMSDDTWWNWFYNNTLFTPVMKNSSNMNDHTLMALLIFLNSYINNPDRKIPNSYILSNVRRLLTDRSASISDFTPFINSCIQIDDKFITEFAAHDISKALTTVALNANGAPIIDDTHQVSPVIRYFKYKANVSISSFRQLLIDIIDIYSCKHIIHAARVLMQANVAITQLPANFPLNLKVSGLDDVLSRMTPDRMDIYPDMYIACQNTHRLMTCLANFNSDNGESLRQYLGITDSVSMESLRNVMAALAHIFTVDIPNMSDYVDYSTFVDHFEGLTDDDILSWCGWMQLLNAGYLRRTNVTRTAFNDNELVKAHLCIKVSQCTDPVYTAMLKLASDDEDRKTITANILQTTLNAKYIIYMLSVLAVIAAVHAFKLQTMMIEISSWMFVFIVVIVLIIYIYNFFTTFIKN